MDQDRILDKIKKCLEMAKGRGSNPNEAEIALRHAHKRAQLHEGVGHRPLARLTREGV